MNMSDDIAELATALSIAQGQIDDASKGSINPHFRSKYADLAAVRSVIREPLAVNGLSIIQTPKTVQGGVEVTTLLLHKSGQWISSSLFMPSGKMDAHGLGSAISYARRYSIMSILSLAADDDDGNAAVERPPQQVPAQKTVTITTDDYQRLLDVAYQVAAQGQDAMRDWWSKLSKKDRDAFTTEDLKALKATAAKVKEAE